MSAYTRAYTPTIKILPAHFAIRPASGVPPTCGDLVYSPRNGRLSRPV